VEVDHSPVEADHNPDSLARVEAVHSLVVVAVVRNQPQGCWGRTRGA
jgi:hypothetical protein